jgi:hypothetical protein
MSPVLTKNYLASVVCLSMVIHKNIETLFQFISTKMDILMKLAHL